MTIKQVYQKYHIPPNLQLHMLRAASVGAFIADHWIGEALSKSAVVQTLLLHDMGNIIKFDFKYSHLLGDEQKNLDYWLGVQSEFRKKYQDEHIATLEIAKEISVEQETLKLLALTGSSKLEQVLESSDWNSKIACYCDFRVSPFGIVTVNERFDELADRYRTRNHDLGDVDKMQQRRLFCLRLEEQLQGMVNFDLNLITEENLKDYLKQLSTLNLLRQGS